MTAILQTAAAFRDPERMIEVYHEASHLFDVPDLDRPSPRWNEGLATFLQYAAADSLEGTARLTEAVARARSRLVEEVARRPVLRQVPFARFGREGLTDLSYPLGLLLFFELHEALGPEAFRDTWRRFREAHAKAGGTTADLAEVFSRAGGDAARRILGEYLFTTGWCDTLAPRRGTGRPPRGDGDCG